jgi:Leucine-rich repeat (LRR) protein
VDVEKERTWKVGDHEFRDGAYQQLLRWLCGIQWPNGPRTVDALVKYMQQRFDADTRAKAYTSSWVNDGQLKAMVLPCVDMGGVDLHNVPSLRYLDCWANELTELNLSRIPELAGLQCGWNQLTELDLSRVPELVCLDCGFNHLTELDLSHVPKLANLDCSMNHLTELDLSHVPELAYLDCDMNHLADLDLSNIPRLTELRCYENQLAEIDIRPCRSLTEVVCDASVAVRKEPNQSVVVHRRPGRTVRRE